MTLAGVEPSEAVMDRVRAEGDKVLLAFSCGKDSIAAWLALRQKKFRVAAFYRYYIPDLDFVEESLRYFEKFFGQKIVRVPHPSLFRWLDHFTFQPPERLAVLERLALGAYDYDAQRKDLCLDQNLPADTFLANGTRAADNLARRTHLKVNGPINWRLRTFYPVWDWTKDGLIAELQSAGVKLPVDYWIWGRSFDGLHFPFLAPLKKYFPRDYERVLEWMPLAELELKRYEFARS